MVFQFINCVPLLALALGLAVQVLAAETADPDASPDARKVLNYLSQLPARFDRRVLSGQQMGARDDLIRRYSDQEKQLREISSRSVAIVGLDYGYPKTATTQSPPRDRSAENQIAREHWKTGGLVMISFHARNPWTGGSAWDTERHDLNELTSTGSAASAAWLQELDAIASALSELRDAGVVVLWRPFPDVNETWFWWGRREGEPFSKEGFVGLWRQMFDYFTKTKRLNNLLWVYSASSGSHKTMSATAYFPGKEYCDIASLDNHTTESVWDGYNEMAQLGKPFGAAEVGPATADAGSMDYQTVIAGVKFWYPLCTFLLAAEEDAALVRNRNAAGLMNDPWVIPRDVLDWAAPGHLRWRQTQKLAVRKVEVLTAQPACWKRVDIRAEIGATYDTPFDPEQIEVSARFTAPSGKGLTLPAFYYQPFERQIWGNGRFSEEVMREAGPPEWRLRFMPQEAGEYRFSIVARDRSGSVESPASTFSASPGTSSGFIRVSHSDPHYFEFEDGTPFFAVGLNIVEHPLSEFYRYLSRLAQNGGNFSRLWIGFDYFALEQGTMGDYRLENAWRLDQVMELSERYGIYQKLCIDWIRHITPRGEPRENFDREDYAYSISNGGPCRTMRDFFTMPEARRLFRNRLRYIVARWGYSPNVMAWELWNEIDLVDPAARDAAVIVPWNVEMCRYLKSIDPWQHLTTNSLSGRELAKALWSLEENQFAQRHGYSTPRPEAVLASADMAGNVVRWLDDVSQYNKPYLMAEFGLQRDRMEVRALCDRDVDGVHMHDGIWAAIAHGAAGTAQLWWWSQYVDPKGLYRHFQAVANFVKGIPWTTDGFTRVENLPEDDNLRVLGLRGKTVSFLWLQNKQHNWWNVINRTPIPAVEPFDLVLTGFPPADYRVEYWDCYQGRVLETAVVSPVDGSMKVRIPRLDADLAIKILLQKRNVAN